LIKIVSYAGNAVIVVKSITGLAGIMAGNAFISDVICELIAITI
jgi:hypothetical protein